MANVMQNRLPTSDGSAQTEVLPGAACDGLVPLGYLCIRGAFWPAPNNDYNRGRNRLRRQSTVSDRELDTRAISQALEDFRRARRQATFEQIMARLTGRSVELLSYDEVLSKLKVKGRAARGLQDIPLDAIVGSVGRYTDFTRSFLPRHDSDAQRWARVEAVANSPEGWPPIEVYQIGQAYFVLDGNHRVSVARQLGATHIQAYVTEIQTKVPLTPDVRPEDLILKAEYAEFLEHTGLDILRPGADLSVTVPGQYRVIEEHIQVHQYFMGIDFQREIPYPEAVAHWYDTVYLPVVEIIRERGILQDFPGRTETDLYLWILEHRAALEKELGWSVEHAAAAADLAARYSSKRKGVVWRLGSWLWNSVIPDELEAGPASGQWRAEQLAARRADRLFTNLLVPVSGREDGWFALEQAQVIAQREGEGSRLLGLHVVADAEEQTSQAAQAVQAEFLQRCRAAGIQAEFAISAGNVTNTICTRSQWVDLVTFTLNYPPAAQPLARLSSGVSLLIRRCPRPLLVVPHTLSPLQRGLLAYDGSAKAREALFVATYLAGRWGMELCVVTASETGRTNSDTLSGARQYLEEHKVAATFIEESGPVADVILQAAAQQGSDVIIMGGYGFSPVLEVVLGSTVDQILRRSHQPTLICR